MATNMTKEEDNFLRIVYLTYRVGTTALRRYFDGFYPNLQSDLSFPPNKAILLDLHKPSRGQRKILYQEQWNILYPSPGSAVVSSVDLDTTLMVCLLRHLPPNISPPAFGFDALPPSHELSDGAHIARIKYYKNFIVSHSKDGKLSDTLYNRIWIDLEMAIHSLGNQQDVIDAADAKSKCLDHNTLKKLVNFDDRLNNHSNELAVQSSKITKLATTIQKVENGHSDLKEKIKKIEIEQEECIPKNIRDQIEIQLKNWEKKDEMFVPTRASDYAIKCISDNSCLTLTAPSGVGKSFIARHTALVLQKKGYKLIPVIKPDDIRDYYQPGKQTVFIVDDICGNFTANQQQIENWQQMLPVINTIIADKCCKIIVSCRLQVYKDDKFNVLEPFKSCECNLMSDNLCLTDEEKNIMAKTYIGASLENIDKLSQNSEFFPLLCYLFQKEKHGDVKDFFKNPFIVYQNELDSLSRCGVEGKNKICILALIVLFNNQLTDKWLKGKVTEKQRQILEDTCEACGVNRSTSKAELKETLLTLDGTFVYKQNGIHKTVHDKLFDFLAHYFGQKMIECLIDHGDSDLVRARFKWRKSPDDKNSNIDFIIEIPDDYLQAYLERLIKDWTAGKVTVVFCNNNMEEPLFRRELLDRLKQLDKSQQVTLANTYDTNSPKEHYMSGTTPLILACGNGYTDIAQWVLHDNVDVDQCRDDDITGMNMASQEGHTNTVKILLQRNLKINQCDSNGCSPLYMASQNGHTEVVRLLLERNPDVNLCEQNGRSPLNIAIQLVHTDIVRLLLKRNPNVNLCDKIYGYSPLYLACRLRNTVIVKLLLERNSNISLCNKNGSSPLHLACQMGYTDIVKLLLERNSNINICDKYECSPLYWASHNGHTDIVRLLLEKNPNIDLCDNNGCSPLYMASRQGHPETVHLLLKQNLDIDLCDNTGSSPLWIASQYGHTNIVRLLLERNPNINKCDNIDGCSPLLTACQERHIDIVKLLLERNPNVDLRNKEGSSPLIIASYQGYTALVSLLLKRNPKIDLSDNYCRNPLEMAIQHGHTDVVRLLLERNSIIELCNNDYWSPLKIAIYLNHTDIVRLLSEKHPYSYLFDHGFL